MHLAIARVDRLGQDKETSVNLSLHVSAALKLTVVQVFCYYVENTIERNILDYAYQHGKSLYVEGGMGLNGDITSKEHKSQSSCRMSMMLDKGDSVARYVSVFKICDNISLQD